MTKRPSSEASGAIAPNPGTPHPDTIADGSWVGPTLLAGDDDAACLVLGGPVSRGELRAMVAGQQARLAAAGLRHGGTVTLVLPPSLAYVATLLAAWTLGAQVSLLDHRLTEHETGRALDRLAPQVVVEAVDLKAAPLSGFAETGTRVTARPGGRPAATPHSLIQLSSGSTGPSKVIARTAADLVAELGRYRQLAEYPQAGERIVLLASIVHVLGLVGGLLHSLDAGVELAFPARLTADGIRTAAAAGGRPTMILGVPFHAELLTAGAGKQHIPNLTRMVVAGELTRPGVPEAFTAAYGVPLGSMYGMTELGVIATDLAGRSRPALTPAPGMKLRVADGELQVAMAASPYIGLADPGRWSGGWLRTRDAARVDPATGLVTILGRLDSQIAIGGLKVDLTEVEQTLCGLPGVATAVVVHDDAIEAYLVLEEDGSLDTVKAELARQLAPFKRPRRLHALPGLPRTATGKIVRDRAALRSCAQEQERVVPALPGSEAR
jgi:3-hydroxy-4-methylanthranilate adenylyltransferase